MEKTLGDGTFNSLQVEGTQNYSSTIGVLALPEPVEGRSLRRITSNFILIYYLWTCIAYVALQPLDFLEMFFYAFV